MKQGSLFRTEAIAHQTRKIYGTVSINIPVPYRVVTLGLALFILGFLVFGLLTDYAQHYVVKGYLNHKLGIVHVYPLRAGIIRQQFVATGQQVARGQILYTVDTSYNNFSGQQSIEYRQLQARLRALHQNRVAKTADLHSLLPLLHKHYISLSAYQALQNELKALEANQHEAKMALIRYKHDQTYPIRAPISGKISNSDYAEGQILQTTKPLCTIVPSDSQLIAQLYIPVSKSGFIHPRDAVTLRYDAYPYQHFGVATGHIMDISTTILSDRQEDKPIQIGEPYYKARVALDHQTIKIRNMTYILQQGMTCSAVIAGIRKKIWQWIFDPIF